MRAYFSASGNLACGWKDKKIAKKNNILDCQCLDLNEVPSEDICKVTTTPACLIMFKSLLVHTVNA